MIFTLPDEFPPQKTQLETAALIGWHAPKQAESNCYRDTSLVMIANNGPRCDRICTIAVNSDDSEPRREGDVRRGWQLAAGSCQPSALGKRSSLARWIGSIRSELGRCQKGGWEGAAKACERREGQATEEAAENGMKSHTECQLVRREEREGREERKSENGRMGFSRGAGGRG